VQKQKTREKQILTVKYMTLGKSQTSSMSELTAHKIKQKKG